MITEQYTNLKFLAKLGKTENEAYYELKKVYGNSCISRVSARIYFNNYSKRLKKLQQQHKVEETDNKKMNINDAENSSSSSTHRVRSNSVVDSGFRRCSVHHKTDTARTRSKSLSTTDYYMSTEHQYMGDDIYVAGPSQTDAKANNISIDKINDSCKEFIAIASVPKDANCYNMNHENRGKCVIFNHEKFDSGNERREGSTLDAKRLQKTFGNLGFDVELHNDFTHNEIMDKISKLAQLDHSDNDCLCVITLTHGVRDGLINARDVIYTSDRLWKPFTADKCKTLAGKPKLFFIQACRGNEADSGVVLSPRSLMTTATDSIVSYVIPTHADFLLAHSSIEGFFTWRNPLEGTWYIQCLCDVFDEHGTTMDLMSMLTLTARKVAMDYSSVNTEFIHLHNKKQVPSVTTMLTRSVYFPPKLKDDLISQDK